MTSVDVMWNLSDFFYVPNKNGLTFRLKDFEFKRDSFQSNQYCAKLKILSQLGILFLTSEKRNVTNL